jgi:hypothetical protein
MTATEWDGGTSAAALLRALERKRKLLPSLRKLQLFAAACLKCQPELLGYAWARPILDFAERVADDPLPDAEYRDRRAELFAAVPAVPGGWGLSGASVRLWRSRLETLFDMYEGRPGILHHRAAANLADAAKQSRFTVALLREVVGNPYRPVALDPAWLTSDVRALATGIHADRAFDRMPILADALQDAGCADEYVLRHCRDARQMHIRGCWVVDLLLGKD